jgi:hypothetical protein
LNHPEILMKVNSIVTCVMHDEFLVQANGPNGTVIRLNICAPLGDQSGCDGGNGKAAVCDSNGECVMLVG